MRIQIFVTLLLIPLLFTACLNDSSVSSQKKEMNSNSAQSDKGNLIFKTNSATVEPKPVSNSNQASKEARNTTQTFSTEELMKELPNLLGSYFFLIKSYKPSHLIGDFNGDGYSYNSTGYGNLCANTGKLLSYRMFLGREILNDEKESI